VQKHLIIIHNLEGLRKYHPYLTTYNLYDNLRNGFAHSFVPKYPLTLSSKAESQHPTLHENNERLNLKWEDFYEDFKIAEGREFESPFPLLKIKNLQLSFLLVLFLTMESTLENIIQELCIFIQPEESS